MARARGRRWRLEDLEVHRRYSLVWDVMERRWEVYPDGSNVAFVTKLPMGRAAAPSPASDAGAPATGAGTAGRHRAT